MSPLAATRFTRLAPLGLHTFSAPAVGTVACLPSSRLLCVAARLPPVASPAL